MADLSGFDANLVDPAAPLENLAPGNYVAAIVFSELKPTKSGNGRYLQLEFEVLEGPHRGRKLWSYLNLENPSAAAVQMAQGELSAICRAVDVLRPSDSRELHNKTLTICVGVKRDSDSGEMRNTIRGYLKYPPPSIAPTNGAAPPKWTPK